MNINYIRVGDYFIPDLTLPEETRPIGKWGRMHPGKSSRAKDDSLQQLPYFEKCPSTSGRPQT